MRFRPIILSWLLLLSATLVMGGIAWWLLGREADRIESLTTGTVANRTATVAENIDLLMAEIRDGVREGLIASAQSPDPRRALSGIVESNPYIVTGYYFRGADAVTVWYGARGSFPLPIDLLPRDEAAQTVFPWTMPQLMEPAVAEERKILSRVKRPMASTAAPSDRFKLKKESIPSPLVKSAESYPADPPQMEVSRNLAIQEQRAAVRKVNEAQSVYSSFSNLESSELLDEESDAYVDAFAEAKIVDDLMDTDPSIERSRLAERLSRYDDATSLRNGWFSKVVDADQSWMAWVELPDGENYLGAWLDGSALKAEFAKVISLSEQGDLRFQLADAQGRRVSLVSQSGADPEPYAEAASLSLAVGSALPGWSILAYNTNSTAMFGGGFRLLGGLFIIGLCFAILLGGVLLLWQAQRDARDAQRKTSFVANVSHELKTPLTSIRLFAEMLTDGRVKDGPKQQVYLQTILNETQRLARLVNNVLDFSRLERGRRDANLQEVDVGAFVQSIVEAQTTRLSSENFELIYEPPEDGLIAPLDCDGLEQILLNLIDNAVKYAGEGLRLDISVKVSAVNWSLQVKDYGPGIPVGERKRVFAAFHRVDDRLTTERPGCGLGLSISSRLAEEMGGKLSLQSNQPSGCCFTLSVPFKREATHA